jgi:hypothetical protein
MEFNDNCNNRKAVIVYTEIFHKDLFSLLANYFLSGMKK